MGKLSLIILPILLINLNLKSSSKEACIERCPSKDCYSKETYSQSQGWVKKWFCRF